MDYNKFCSKCSIEKPNSDFSPGRKICKTCRNNQSKEYYKNNKDKFPSNYVPTGKPRGRPRKLILDEDSAN